MAIIGNSIVAVRPIDTELSSTSENAIANKTVNAAIASVRNEIGTPLVANTAAEMTDTNKIYVYVGSETGYTNGNWYYYDGSHWVSGGVYNSQGFETDKTLMISDAPADAKTVGDKFDETDQNIQNTKDEIEEDIGELSNAISQKAPVIINTASGDIATFADGADGMPIKHLIANIEPVQSGTGDPSPSNVRPITGWTGLSGQACGKNLIDPDEITIYPNNLRCYVNHNILLKGGATYYFGTTIAVKGLYIQTPSGTDLARIYDRQVLTYTPTEDVYVKLDAYWSSDILPSGGLTKDLVYLSVGTNEDYAPYQGQTISVSWQSEAGMVYGGTLDVVTGELTVTRVHINASNLAVETAYGNANAVGIRRYQILCTSKTSGNITSNICKSMTASEMSTAVNTNEYVIGVADAGNTRFIVSIPVTSDSVADAKDWLVDNAAVFVVPLATPQTYQLDPITVNTLLGNNTVYVDCGSVTVDYPADTGIVVAEQSNAIEQKQNATSYVTLSGTIVTQTGADNTMYLCGELAELTFTAPATGITAIRFTSGTTATVVTLNGITMPDDWTGAEASTIYEINVLNGYGAWQSWT